MPKPKRHHFLPESYLNGFVRDGLVWVFDRETKEFRRQPPRNTAVIGHFYAFDSTSGEKDYGLETEFSKIEGIGKRVIDQLEAGNNLTIEERVQFASYLALMFCRVPKFAREIEDIADGAVKHLMKHMHPTVEVTAEHLRRRGKEGEIDPMHMFNFIHNEQFRMKGNRNIAIKTMLHQAPALAKEIAVMDWMVVHAKGAAAFITTDSPFGYIIPAELRATKEPIIALTSQRIVKVVPLSSSVALLLGKSGAAFGHVDFQRQQIRDLNLIIAKECDRYVIGRDEPLVRSIARRSGVATGNPGTRMRVDHIPHPKDPSRTFTIVRRVSPDTPDEPLQMDVE